MARVGHVLPLLLPLLLALALGASAEEPAPPRSALASLAVAPEEAARLDGLLAELATAAHRGRAPALRSARVRLRRAGVPALARVALALERADPAGPPATELVRLLAASERAEVDEALAQAARACDPAVRAEAAAGLARARTGAAIEVLATLTADPLPGVRAAAWRALFAREEPAAVAARGRLPEDPEPALHARRLTLHRLREDVGEGLTALALTTWRSGTDPASRLAAARLLAASGSGASLETLEEIVQECGHGPVAAALARWSRGRPLAGHASVEERRAAIEALATALDRPTSDGDAPQAVRHRVARAAWIERALELAAHPVAMDPQGADSIPEQALRRRLAGMGAPALAALERRLERGGFRAPRDGTTLLAEFPPELALPVLMRLVARDRPQEVRVAASSALRTLGTLGTEALAITLTHVDEEPAIRRDAISALATDPGAWVVALLGTLLERRDAETVDAAADALEQRDEPEARRLLEDFALGERCPEHRTAARLTHLLRPWDERARATWARALASERGHLRGTALALAARLPLAQLNALLPSLRAYEPRLGGAREVEAWIGALARAAPREALAYVRTRWTDFPVGPSLASTQCRALAALDLVRDPALEPEVVALLLERAGASDDAHVLTHALDALAGRRGTRDAELDAFFARLLEGRGVAGPDERREEVAASAVAALATPGRGDLTAPLLALLERHAGDGETAHRAVAVLAALRHQPWAPVEEAVLALALDPTRPPPVRAAAGWLLAGRVGPAGRARLLAWLLDGRQGESEPAVLLALAAATGLGAAPEQAQRLAQALRDEVLAFHTAEPPPDPFEPRIDALPMRVQALASAVAHAGALEPLARLAALLFEPRFVRWADAVLLLPARWDPARDALGALAAPCDPRVLRLETGAEHASILAPEAAQVALGLKALGDAALAQALAPMAAGLLEDAAGCAFPDAWPAKLAALLHDPRSGDLERSAQVLEAMVDALDPWDGAFDLALAEARAERAFRRDDFDAAALAMARARALLARRGDELHPSREGAWRRMRTLEGAYRAAAHGARGDAPSARRELASLSPDALRDDPPLLARVALLAGRAGLDERDPERMALFALALERRTASEESLEVVAALAEILLRKGRALEAARRLDDALGPSGRPEHGRHHLLLARCQCAGGLLESAERSLRRALLVEPTLARTLADDPWLAPLRADGALARLLADVEAARRRGEEE